MECVLWRTLRVPASGRKEPGSIFRREKVICRVSDPHLQVLFHKAYELETVCPTVLTEQAVFRALAK